MGADELMTVDDARNEGLFDMGNMEDCVVVTGGNEDGSFMLDK